MRIGPAPFEPRGPALNRQIYLSYYVLAMSLTGHQKVDGIKADVRLMHFVDVFTYSKGPVKNDGYFRCGLKFLTADNNLHAR